MVSAIKYSAKASSDHHPNQVPGILIIINPKQPNLPTCSIASTYLLFHLLLNPSLCLTANTILGIITATIKISPKTLNQSILFTCANFGFSISANRHCRFKYKHLPTNKRQGARQIIAFPEHYNSAYIYWGRLQGRQSFENCTKVISGHSRSAV